MKYAVIDKKGKELEQIELDDSIFGVKPNKPLLAQYIRVFDFNQRQGTSHTKTRSEVAGGGRKPWRQKGTGRARHGSIRSPIWRHGGVAHGPRSKDWGLKMPKKMKVAAIKSALSDKFLNKKAIIMDSLDIEKPSTKSFMEILGNLDLRGKTLVVSESKIDNLIKSVSNIPGAIVSNTGILNAHDLINCRNVIFSKDAVKSLEKRYKK